MGIDSNTNSLAFSIFEDGKLIEYGKVEFKGKDIYARITDCNKKTMAFAKKWKVDLICIESAVVVRSVKVALSMAMMNGVMLGNLTYYGATVVGVTPLQWQSAINNKTLTRKERADFKKLHPEKSASWISIQIRAARKQFTIDFVNDLFKIKVTDDDVSDSIAIGLYGVENY